MYSFITKGQYNIYVDVKNYPKPPSNWKHINKIIDPEITKHYVDEGEPPLPYIYDILSYIGMKQAGLSKENNEKIEAILSYCLDERYQKNILPGYGILLAPTGNYYGMGWSVHIPCFNEPITETADMKKLLLYAEMFSYFEAFKKCPIIANLLDFTEKYRDKDGFYNFPKKFIPEENRGYFVNGKHMGLGENKRQKEANANESTFRMLKLKKNLGIFQ